MNDELQYDFQVGIESSTNINIMSQDEAKESRFETLRSLASDNTINKQKDLMYINFVLCHEGSNANCDYFFRNELDNAKNTPIHKAYDWEHGSPIIGVITDSIFVQPAEDAEDKRCYIECGAVVWKWMFPDFAKQIEQYAMSGELRNSMECWFSDYCIVVGSGENQKIYDRHERPDLENYIGTYYGGELVCRGLIGVIFGGCGCVKNPADKDAIFKSVASRNPLETIELLNNDKEEVIETVEDKEKVEATETVVDSQSVESTEATETIEEEVVETPTETTASEEVTEVEEKTEEIVDENSTEASVEENKVEEKVTKEDVKDAKASLFDEILSRWAKSSEYWNSFDAISYAVEDIMFSEDLDGEQKKAKMKDELDAFASKILSLLPDLLSYYGFASTDAAVADAKAGLNDKLAELQTAYDTLKSEYETYKSEVEAKEAEAQLDALADKRVADLVGSGLSYDDDTLASLKSKVKAMSEEQYLELKNLLIATKYGTKASEVQRTEETHEEKTEASLDVTKPVKALGSLNVESKPEATQYNFERLVNKLVD